MAESLILVGAGGCMKEVLWQIREINQKGVKWNVVGYVAKEKNSSIETIPYLGDDEYLLKMKEPMSVLICIGESKLRKIIVTKLKRNKVLQFPAVVMNEAIIADDAVIKEGCIICSGSLISTEVELEEFTFVNTKALVSHECKLGKFVTISPSVSLAGNVHIGEETEIGIGATVIQNLEIGKNSIVGAGATVISDIPDFSVAVGVPARVVKNR